MRPRDGMLGGMHVDEYTQHDATGLRALIAGGEVSADEVETAAREALDAANARVNGLAALPFTPALDHDPDGPLAGVPFLYKDVGPTAAGVPFYGGSRAVPGIRPDHDSDLMRRVRAAGLKTLGLTTTPELGMALTTEPLRTGPTRNPFDPERSAGGSSGGSAALVAAGAVPIAHGSDGAGSLRVPAACCGVIGLKPTRGRIPCGPDIGEALFGLSEHFALTRTLRDTAALLDALHGPCAGDKYMAPPPRRSYAAEVGADPGHLRVALWTDGALPETAAAAEATAQALADAGHAVEPQAPPVDDDAVAQMLEAGLATAVEPFLRAPRRPPANLLEAMTNRSIADLQTLGALELMDAFAAQNRVSRAIGRFLRARRRGRLSHPRRAAREARRDRLQRPRPHAGELDPIAALLQPVHGRLQRHGQPAISLPLARDASGLPIGVQLVAGYGREDVLLRVASQLIPAAA